MPSLRTPLPHKIDEWRQRFNIQVVRYRASGADHSELAALLSTLQSYVGDQPFPPRQKLEVDLKVAQSLYMWHKFQVQPQSELRIDAFKALVLSIAAQSGSGAKPVTRGALRAELELVAGLPEPELETSLDESLKALSTAGLLSMDRVSGKVRVSNPAVQLVKKFRDQYFVLLGSFKKQTMIDFASERPGLNESQLSLIADLLVETVTAMFSERGIEIVNMIFAEQQPRLAGAAALFRMIFSGARRLQDSGTRYAFVRYTTRLLSEPSPNQERFLEYLSKPFVCIHALSIGPDGNRFRREFLSNRTLIVDDNILIPLLAAHGSKSAFFDGLLRAAVERGMRLATSQNSIDEVYAHMGWAEGFVAENGDSPTEVLRAALGHGSYKKNAFLDGWIRYSAEEREASFADYMRVALGERTKRGYIERRLRDLYGMAILEFKSLGEIDQEAYVIREEVEQFITQKAEEGKVSKSAGRVKTEAEVYAYLYLWSKLAPKDVKEADWKSSFLSQGGFLNRIAIEGPYPIG